MPTKPAKTLHSTKLRITIAFTRTPASAAPCLLPPTATEYMPQRVATRMTCTNATASSAQMNSEYVPWPKMLANVPVWLTCSSSVTFCPLMTCVTFSTVEVTSAPGICTGAAWEMISVSPPSPSSMPSVVMNDEPPKTSVMTPLMIPTNEHTISEQN